MTDAGLTELIIDKNVLEAIEQHGAEGYPDEVCGVLVGSYEDGMRIRRVQQAHRARNNNHERAEDRYDLDPRDYQSIEDQAAEQALEVVGIYHTHPDHPSQASETDRLRAVEVWQDQRSWSYLIVEVAGGQVASWHSWVLDNQRFFQEQTRVVD